MFFPFSVSSFDLKYANRKNQVEKKEEEEEKKKKKKGNMLRMFVERRRKAIGADC